MGRYTLMRRFAVGGMAELYLAHQRGAEGFAKVVALKRILPHLAADPQFTKMFLDEARLASGLAHPNIAQVLDFGAAEGEYYLTMEYVHGRHLLDLMRARPGRPLPLAVALDVVGSIARALHHVHEQRGPDGRALGLVHRDVSPSNVLIAYDGSVKLTDFGIAKAMDLTSATRTGTFKGKLGYASPEQCRGEAIDRRSDIYALGILLYETTTGVRAFSGPNEFAVLGRVAAGKFVPPQEVDPTYPPALRKVVAKAMALESGDRYPTASALAEALEDVARAIDLRASSTIVGGVMVEHFGAPPPIAAPAELRLGEPTVVDPDAVTPVQIEPPRVASPSRRAVVLPWVLSGVTIVAAVSWVMLREPKAAPAPAPAPQPVPVAAPDPPPVVVQRPDPPAPEPDPEPPVEPAAEPEAEPEAEPAPTATRRKPRKKRRPSSKPASSDRDALYPPGHAP
jgi:serine/threonine-protein kinase